MTFRYIGSKARLAEPLAEAIRPFLQNGGRFIDAFAGTGAVTAVAADDGWPVQINDTLSSAVVMSIARMIATQEARFERLGGYQSALDKLNALDGICGYFHKTYSPASALYDVDRVARLYLTETNARRLDAIREQVSRWRDDQVITYQEEKLLLADIMAATNRVANIAGTYGCFLSRWQPNALNALTLTARTLREQQVDWLASISDAETLSVGENDLVYLDPPYTKRQYAAYYHILESIVLDDQPAVEGVSGLRPWRHKASAFCYKRKALQALTDLVNGMRSRHVLMSYSSEAHVSLADLVDSLEATGSVTVSSVKGVGRYRPNRVASSRGDTVTEYLISYSRFTTIANPSVNQPRTLVESRQ